MSCAATPLPMFDCCQGGPDEWRQLWCETVAYGNQAVLPVYFSFGQVQSPSFNPARIFRALTHHVDCTDFSGNPGTADQTITIDPATGATTDSGIATTGIGFPSSLWSSLGPDFSYFAFSDSGYEYSHASGSAYWHETAIWSDEVHWWDRWQPMIDFLAGYGLPGSGILSLPVGQRRIFSYDPYRTPLIVQGTPVSWAITTDRGQGDTNPLAPPWTTVPYELARLNAIYFSILGTPSHIYASVARGYAIINSTNNNCVFSETAHGGNAHKVVSDYACTQQPAGAYAFEPEAPVLAPDFIDRFSGLQPISGAYPLFGPPCCNPGP